MRKLINVPVEILNKDMDTQAFPLCDNSGFTIGSAESYGHALEITEAVSNYDKVVELLQEARDCMGLSVKTHTVQKKIAKFFHPVGLTH